MVGYIGTTPSSDGIGIGQNEDAGMLEKAGKDALRGKGL
jgi:hypothetical protein